MRQFALRISALLTAVLATGVATAHEGHSTHQRRNDPLPLALLVSGLLVFGAGLYLATREDVERIYALVGIGLGLAGLAAALVLYLRQGF